MPWYGLFMWPAMPLIPYSLQKWLILIPLQLLLLPAVGDCDGDDCDGGDCDGGGGVAVIRSGDKYMFDELSEDEMASSTEVLEGSEDAPAAADTRPVPVTPDWREEKIGVGPVEVPRVTVHHIWHRCSCTGRNHTLSR